MVAVSESKGRSSAFDMAGEGGVLVPSHPRAEGEAVVREGHA